jgi:HEAT repeat protein
MTSDGRAAALIAERDEERHWELLINFVRADPEAARQAGLELLSADSAPIREVAADLLRQTLTAATMSANEVAEALLPRLKDETDPAALAAAILALGHTRDERARTVVIRLGSHESVAVRFAVAFTLPRFDLDSEALGTLRRLSRDPDDHARDWATFALAESDARDAATIDALVVRVDDGDDDTRAEAILGLARRRDPRARALVERELRRPVHGELIERAFDELNS